MQITGVDASWAPYLNQLVQRENASGNPNAVNPTAVSGEHATGFLQTLPSTFKANAAPGMTNINDPVDNAVAAINYIKSRYRSPANIPGLMSGSYHGY
jgi:SLT domain-containing protein